MSASDEFDDRFRALIRDEFDTEVPNAGPTEPSPPEVNYDVAPEDFFSLDAALEAADPTPDEADRFVPPAGEPIGRPRRPRIWAGLACIGVGLVILILLIVGVPAPSWLGPAGAIAWGVGLGLLLFSLPKRRNPDDDGVRL